MMMFKVIHFVFAIVLIFSSAAYAKGAGVTPLVERDGEAFVLLGKQRRPGGYAWSSFGGNSLPGEDSARTALRTFKEKTGYTSFPSLRLNDIQRAPFVDHHHPTTGVYREFFLDMRRKSITTTHDIKRNAQRARWELGPNNHIEMEDWGLFKATYLLYAAKTGKTKLPGTNDHLYSPYLTTLKAAASQARIANFIASVRASIASRRPKVIYLPSPRPILVRPVPRPILVRPVPMPILVRPAPMPILVRPAPRPILVRPAPRPILVRPAPMPILVRPAPRPIFIRERAPYWPYVVRPAPRPVFVGEGVPPMHPMYGRPMPRSVFIRESIPPMYPLYGRAGGPAPMILPRRGPHGRPLLVRAIDPRYAD